MKLKSISLSLFGIAAVGVLTAGVMDSSGKLGNTGSPGENTCSQAGCHGSGSGGLADNAGPGSITLSANPAFTNGNYLPNQLYHITITVAETGKSLFGFDFEAIDNSGATTFGNNSMGTITVTDAAHTRKGQPAQFINGNVVLGRFNITHQKNGGVSANSKQFNFDWTAPASGIVNLYIAGIAANGDGVQDAADNVYKTNMQLTASTLGVVDINQKPAAQTLMVYPNPVKESAAIGFYMPQASMAYLSVYDVTGALVKVLCNTSLVEGRQTVSFNREGLEQGIYFVKLQAGSLLKTTKIMVVN